MKGLPAGTPLALGSTGRILVGGKLPSEAPGVGGDVAARVAAARSVTLQGGLLSHLKLDAALEAKVTARLVEGLAQAPKLKGAARRNLESATVCLLIDLAAGAPKGPRLDATASAALGAIGQLRDREMAGFYLASAHTLLGARLGAAPRAELASIQAELMPSTPPVDAWTANGTRPLVVRHTIHEEFWKEELAYFSPANGFTLKSKNAQDTQRRYSGLIPDPAGKKQPLRVDLLVKKGEMDYLEPMSEPQVHVILYSGHSALGGNGDQAIDASGPMRGPLPKLVMAANCRGKDNYATFANKYPDAHVIMTEHPTYSTSGELRVDALFKTLARGGDYASMRKLSEKPAWDEPADNYFYPDEWRKFRFMDADEDGQVDATSDRFFEPGRAAVSDKFVRAVNFTNSELFYHWEIEAEKGRKSFFGREYADAVVADGPIRGGPLPEGRLVEVRPVSGTLGGESVKKWLVRFDADRAKDLDENLYAGQATMQTVLALTVDQGAGVKIRDALRAVLMGAQAIYYLDVYSDSNPKNQRAYFDSVGLPGMDARDVNKLFKDFDAHASLPQLAAFREVLEKKHHLDLQAWLPRFLAAHGPDPSTPVRGSPRPA